MLKSRWSAIAMKLSPWPEDLVKKLESSIDVRNLSEDQWSQELFIRIRRLAKEQHFEGKRFHLSLLTARPGNLCRNLSPGQISTQVSEFRV